MDALRHSNGPQTTRQLAETVHAAKGVPTTPDRIGKERINRVRAVCKKLTTVERETGADGVVVWQQAG